MERDSSASRPASSNLRKAQSSNAIIRDDLSANEESKSGFGGSFIGQPKEAPPRDNNERIERLLVKLERAAQTSDMELMSHELRYLSEFDLHLNSYSDDQIKRAFIVSPWLYQKFKMSDTINSII